MSSDIIPSPDPTDLTKEQLHREIGLMENELTRRLDAASALSGSGLSAERDYVNAQLDVIRQRFADIDKATELLSTTVNRTPTEITKEVTHLRDLQNERFQSIDKQFHERDTRSERESRDNKVAVDAAFAAQKEAAAKQDESNLKAIDKSEKATAETIKTLSELFQTNNNSLSDKIDDLKARVNTAEARVGTNESNNSGIGERLTAISTRQDEASRTMADLTNVVVQLRASLSGQDTGAEDVTASIARTRSTFLAAAVVAVAIIAAVITLVVGLRSNRSGTTYVQVPTVVTTPTTVK